MNWKILSISVFLAGLILVSCSDRGVKFPQAKVSDLTQTDVKIKRYGKTLFELDTTDLKNELKRIQPEFNLFLNADLDDSANIRQLYNYVSDTQLISIYRKTMEVFPDLIPVESELSAAFSRFQVLFPDAPIPNVYTYISDMYFERPVWIQDSIMVVAIDLYLGNDFPLYARLGLPYYKVMWMQPQSLVIDVMKALYFAEIAPSYRPQTLLDRMVDAGKLLVFLDAVLPDLTDDYKISYTTEQLNWAYQNEENVWAFLVGNDLLYSKDYQTHTKLMKDAPFTTGFGNESPSRLGVFIGWEIALSYLKNNPDVTLEEFFKMTDSQLILKKSGYRP